MEVIFMVYIYRIRSFHLKLRANAVPLMAGLVLALIWVHIDPSSYSTWMREPSITVPFLGPTSFAWLVNDVFMAFFFGLVTAHIVTTLASYGGVRDIIVHAFNPFLAMAFGVIVPALLFILTTLLLGHPDWIRGFGIVTATDIAIAWLAARLALGPHHPAISFLLLVAIGDDIVSMLIIALFYSNPDHPLHLPALAFVLFAVGLAWLFRRVLPNQWALSVFLAGGLSWYGLYRAGLHPSLALVPIVPFLPTAPQPAGASDAQAADHEKKSAPLHRFESTVSGPVDDGLFLFALANAGVPFSTFGPLSVVIALSLFVGKTAGIYMAGRLTESIGWLRAVDFDRFSLLVIALSSASGLTVSLFMAEAAFPDDRALQAEAKVGALFSLLFAASAAVIGRIGRKAKRSPAKR
ncbi:hypothetical protein SA87_10505 [Hydrogenibacillus schlegelii]|uniref:Na+/H+ antiporter NhaA type n=1 Tax=Hydrogenibacillus schlegelii TaxID=1484 RepID=A0A179ISD1_HYDSH|nr:hypothetical protein SA87_10505 [Hydrogenibacillus schlegelii]